MVWARLRKHLVVIAAVVVWLPAVGYGIHVLWKYSTTPGRAASPPREWPSGAPVRLARAGATLLMFAHPQCECTRASVGELAIIMTRARGKVGASVFFYRPAKERPQWAQTALWKDAAEIPGTHVFEDPDGNTAGTFGVFTSGQTLLYGDDGRLLFAGGVTGLRGHSGDNAGRNAVVALLNHPFTSLTPAAPLPVIAPVLGCSLREE